MTQTRLRFAKKFVAAFVTAALLLTAPGLPCYQALAQVSVNLGAATGGAVGGQAGAAAVNQLSVDVVDAAGIAPMAGIGSGGLAGLRALSPAQGRGAAAKVLATSLPATPLEARAYAGASPAPQAFQIPAASYRSGVGGAVARQNAGPRTLAPSADGQAAVGSIGVAAGGKTTGVGDFSAPASQSQRASHPAPGAPTAELIAHPELLLRPAAEIAAMPAAAVRETGQAIMDVILRARSVSSADRSLTAPAAIAPAELDGARGAAGVSGLRPAQVAENASGSTLAPPGAAANSDGTGSRLVNSLGARIRGSFRFPAGPRSAGSKAKGLAASLLTIAASAAGVIVAQKGLALLLPAIFGAMPVAAAWALGSGLLIVPAALYTRYRLGLRDSPRLKWVKTALDHFLGLYLGAALVAAPGLGTAAALAAMAKILPLALSAQAAHSLLSVGGVLGMMSLPAMTTIAFYLGRVIASAESGRPFGIPGSMQAIRFPAFTWVMTGVVFALLTGYAPFYVNLAFFFWMFFGSRSTRSLADKLAYLAKFNVPLAKAASSLNKIWRYVTFDNVFIAAAAYAAFTGFAAPITFLVLAFAPERAAMWTERFLAKVLPASDPAPSSVGPGKVSPQSETPAKWPKLHLWLKTGFFIGDLAGLGFLMAATVFGWHAFLVNTAVAAAMAFIPFWFGTKIIKAVTKSTPTDEAHDPEIFGAMKDLRARINSKRAAAGKKPIPMPEIVNVPMPVPNAFATGRDPFHALVGVTEPFKDMTLDPENLRAGLARLMISAEAEMERAATPQALESARKQFAVFRLAAAGSIRGVSDEASPEEVAGAVRAASEPELRDLGRRVLRGVLGHEFTHVMERHMLIGTITGSITSGIAFASYGVMWALGHARYMGKKAWEKIAGRTPRPPAAGFEPSRGPSGFGGARGNAAQKVEPEMVEPVTTTIAALKAVAGLAKVFAALWGPIIAQILQMTVSRQDEGLADEGGALLSEDPEALALGLGLLTTWRPPSLFSFDLHRLPFVAATGHLFTVNPLRQLQEAGALPGNEAGKPGRPLERQDDWLFNLFITHPDTGVRIERLYEMARARRAGSAGPSAPPGPGGVEAPERLVEPAPGRAPGGKVGMLLPPGHAPPGGLYASLSPANRKSFDAPIPVSRLPAVSQKHPLNLSPPDRPDGVPRATAPDAADEGSGAVRGGLFRKAWGVLSSPLRVLPDEGRNREFWKFVFGQALIQLGVNFHYTALPGLIAPTKAEAAKIGYNRAVNWGAQAAASLSTGPMIDRSSIKNILVWPYLGRSILLFLVPVVFFNLHLITGFVPALTFFALFQGIIFLAGFLQSMGLNAASVAFNRIVAEDTDHYNRANAVYNIVLNVVGVIGPLLAGVFISAMLPYFGPLSGNALAYGVYGALALGVAVFYGLFLRLPRDEVIAARRALAALLTAGPARNPRVRGIGAERGRGVPVLLVEVSGDPREASAGIPGEFQGYRVKVVAQRRQLAEVVKGVRLTWKDRFLRLTTIFSTLENMTGDALVFAAIPRLIADKFGLGTAALAGAGRLPLVGPFLAHMPGQGLAFGLILAASSLGLGVSSLPMMNDRDRSGAELDAALAAFRGRLAAQERLSDEVLDAAEEAAHDAVARVLDAYRAAWAKDPDLERTPAGFQADILRSALEEINREAFDGRRGPEDMARLASATSLDSGLAAWSALHFDGLMREARTEARTGLNRMERQGRWTSILYGLGALAYWGVFFSPGIWGAVGWMLASALLQGAATIVWSSLTTRLLQEKYRDDQGKIYSAISLYVLICSIAGVLGFGAMMAAIPTATALWVVSALMTVVAAAHIVEPYVVFPIDRTKVRRNQ